MEEFIVFLAAISIIVVFFYIAVDFYEIAKMKGFSQLKYFWIPFLFPLFGYLLVIALPDRSQGKEINKNPSAEQDVSGENDELPDL